MILLLLYILKDPILENIESEFSEFEASIGRIKTDWWFKNSNQLLKLIEEVEGNIGSSMFNKILKDIPIKNSKKNLMLKN